MPKSVSGCHCPQAEHHFKPCCTFVRYASTVMPRRFAATLVAPSGVCAIAPPIKWGIAGTASSLHSIFDFPVAATSSG